MKINNFKEQLKLKMDEYVHFIYRVSRKFPKDELYGSVSQIRRATLSIILNYIEGFARKRPAVQLNFYETSYGSLKESRYLLDFSKTEDWITLVDYNQGIKFADEIGAMLWTEISSLEKSLNKS
jgi:four helix bundle protein